ncbi:hypothetical protein E5163_14890 [Marinicauda algicola]|uniref:Uncharacterized protein n=1 Tax=Marinicauda algicola TaxID=2029849 RepID=A0A4S2GX59_9PROT|nr:hypothetical protein [Marinicauda algicola]TGY87352.1 hypothetical protein E5163_14890 [Marinicauda algicola]
MAPARAAFERLARSDRVRVAVVNETALLAPRADLVGASDGSWWSHTAFDWRASRALKVSAADGPHCREGVVRIVAAGHEMRFERRGCVGAGGSSAFQVLNLLAQFGAARIGLIGIDAGEPVHWHGEGWPFAPGARLKPWVTRTWRTCFDAAAGVLADRGIEVVNLSPVSALTAYPRRDLTDWIEEHDGRT